MELFERRGGAAYFGEPVSQLEHALQTAFQAEQEDVPGALVAAALLHDIGHLLHKLPEDIADRGVDGRHERIGAAWLARYFPPAVTEPIRLHVAAKRYLGAVDAAYQRQLSAASIQSLALQGGPMSADEVREFEASAYASLGVRLRRWDDLAKAVGLKTQGLAKYQSLLEKLACKIT
ncbi:MAG: HD domain-containing protein [Blastocatellia bacterium]|nr:HD domain-containing protein [Blastocatellia bacterium]